MRSRKKILRYVFLGTGLGFYPGGPIILMILSTFRAAVTSGLDAEFTLGMFWQGLSVLFGGIVGGTLGYVVSRRIQEKETAARTQNALLRFAECALWGVVLAFVGGVVGLVIAGFLVTVMDSAPDSPLWLYALAGGPIGIIAGLGVAIYTHGDSG